MIEGSGIQRIWQAVMMKIQGYDLYVVFQTGMLLD